jgi:hypothetical protein
MIQEPSHDQSNHDRPAITSPPPHPTAKRFSRVPSMFDSLGVEVPYPT